MSLYSRRGILAASSLLLCGAVRSVENQLSTLEADFGGRIGVAAYDLTGRRKLEHRANERFAMCSTFKVSLAAAILQKAYRADLSLAKRLSFDPARLLPNSPALSQPRSEPAASLEELCAAIVEVSDNTAANLLLDELGGPSALTQFFRSLGDRVSRLDRMETELNSNIAGDVRDTTTPKAMALNLKAMLIDGHALDEYSRQRLTGWMLAEKNGARRIRAGVPSSWRVANKPGTSGNGAVNDISLIWRDDGAPIILSIYANARGASTAAGEQAIRSAASIAAAHLS